MHYECVNDRVCVFFMKTSHLITAECSLVVGLGCRVSGMKFWASLQNHPHSGLKA